MGRRREGDMSFLSETLAIGRGVVDFVKPLFDLFGEDGFAPALAFYLFGTGMLAGVIFLVGYVIPIRFKLWRNAIAIRKSGDYQGFARSLHDLDQRFTRTRLLRHPWREFRETLIEPQPDSGESLEVRNTVRPQAFFNVQEAGLHFRFFRSLPNLFVGLGLLFTFFGLVSALYFATSGVKEGASIAQTQEALRQLLHAASFKFYTSVSGLGSSLVLGLLIRWGTTFIETGFESLSEALEERLRVITPESVAYEQHRETKQQTEYLKLFTTDVAISVGRYIEEALNNSLPLHLAKAMEPVSDKLAEVTGTLTRMNEDALRTMADGFGEKLQGAAGDQMKALAGVLQDLRSSLDGISARMSSSGEELATRVRESSEEMRAAVAAMAGVLSEVTAKAEGGASRSQEALERQTEAAQRIMTEVAQRMAENAEAATQRVASNSADAAANFAAEIGKAARGLQESSAQIATLLSEAVAKIAGAAGDASARVVAQTEGIGIALTQGAQDASEKAGAAIKTAGDEAANALAGVASTLQTSVADMVRGLEGTSREMRELERGLSTNRAAMERITQSAGDTESAMSNAARAIREASGPLTIAGQTMADSSRKIGEAIGGAVISIQASEERTRALADRISQSVEQVSRTWSDYEKRFAGVDQSLETALEKIIGHVEANIETMHKYMREVDEKLAETVDRLGGGISELAEFSETIEKATGELRGSIDRFAAAA